MIKDADLLQAPSAEQIARDVQAARAMRAACVAEGVSAIARRIRALFGSDAGLSARTR